MQAMISTVTTGTPWLDYEGVLVPADGTMALLQLAAVLLTLGGVIAVRELADRRRRRGAWGRTDWPANRMRHLCERPRGKPKESWN
jgi:hypothetical protein